MYTAIENNPITVHLPDAANSTGWSIPGDGTAVHTTCNAGYISLLNFPVKAGRAYTITYTILAISSGYVQAFAGGTGGSQYTTPNVIVETIIAASDGTIQLFSNANCTIQLFNIKDLSLADGVTIVYSAINKKWSDVRTMYPDFGFSLYEFCILAYQGAIYAQQNGSQSRNNFFGQQYQSSIKFVDAKNPQIVNGFEALNYQANMLLVTTRDGITTSLGQVSTLIDTDFSKSVLTDGNLSVIIYDNEGVYSASFLQDENEDIVDGSPLRGNYIIIELITVDGSAPLKLFSVAVRTTRIPIGSR